MPRVRSGAVLSSLHRWATSEQTTAPWDLANAISARLLAAVPLKTKCVATSRPKRREKSARARDVVASSP